MDKKGISKENANKIAQSIITRELERHVCKDSKCGHLSYDHIKNQNTCTILTCGCQKFVKQPINIIYLVCNLESSDKLSKMGKKQLEDGKYEDALNSFEQAISLNQNDPDLWNLKGIALRSLGRYNEAINCFNKSLEIDPRDKNSS